VKALIYTRVSDDQRDGRSPAEQEAEARAVCDREGWDVVEVLSDAAGASRHSRKARPGWDAAKALIAGEAVGVLVTWEASRAERKLSGVADLIDLCADHGVMLSYKGRTYDPASSADRFSIGLGGLVAAREADETSERVLRAMRQGAARGRPHGRLPYGYLREYAATSRKPELVRQYPHPTTGPVVGRIFAGYLAGTGTRSIATGLNADGIAAPKGGRWDDVAVRRVLRNPAYAGRRIHNGVMIDTVWDGWEPIVDGETFDRVQARLDRQGERQVRQTATARLLTGVARCGVCGGRVRVVPRPGGRKTYSCRERHCVGRSLDKLDAYVVGEVLERLEEPDVADALGDAADPEADEARARGAALRAELDEAFTLWKAGKLSVGAYARMEQDLQERIEAADREARRALVPIEVDVPDGALDDWWDGLGPERQREVIAALVAAVTIHPLRPGMDRRRFYPELVAIAWR